MNAETRSHIEQLFARLCYCADRSDGDGAAALFTKDCIYDAAGTEIVGADAVAKTVSALAGAITRHCITSVIVEDEADGEIQATATALIAVNRDGDTSLVAADYRSTFVQEGGDWKLKHHSVAPAIRVPGAAG